jgi:hypothetical protein
MPDLHVLNALELAIQACGTRSGDFWLHTAAALRSFRAAIEAVERLDASGLEERITGELVVSPRTLVASAAAGAGGHPAQGVA